MMRTDDRARDAGQALLVTLSALLLVALFTAGWFTVVSYRERIAQMAQAHQTVYWLAFGHARAVLAQLEAGQNSVGPATLSFYQGVVTTSAVKTGSVWTVTVQARSSDATEVVTFRFDSQQKRVTQWQENLPTPVDNDAG